MEQVLHDGIWKSNSLPIQEIMSFKFGILQGRLSPSLDGRFQFFPKAWEEEFHLAAKLGFVSIEWLFDWPDWETNPILMPALEENIRRTVETTGVPVNSICADYFMKHRLAGPEGEKSGLMAVRLVHAAARLTKQKLVLIPFLEDNAYPTEAERTEAMSHLMPAVREAERLGVCIGFETEMPVKELLAWLDRFRSAAVGAYYDIGNCTSYGFDCPSDLRALGKRVFGVHIKDRKVGSAQSVALGDGDADLIGCLTALKKIGFHGVLIMQAWRGDDFLQDARSQLSLLRRLASPKENYDDKQLQKSL